ncbi:sugar dehydrogenase complex small subunit [Erwinia tasmaniensis]|uniref:sugar dehydrogenase complex small subunit n=1 Tax=Erwinia tasmaniensis TaxID=338565 RepID=UPI003A4D79A6
MPLTRRRLLASSAGLLAAGVLTRWLPGGAVIAAAPQAQAFLLPDNFLLLSRQLTGTLSPDPVLAQRLHRWLHATVEDLDHSIDRLTALLAQEHGQTLPASLPPDLQALAHMLISGWYLGVVGREHPRCIGFENIVSYRLVRDSLLPPSYAPGAPNFWTKPPAEGSQVAGQPLATNANPPAQTLAAEKGYPTGRQHMTKESLHG